MLKDAEVPCSVIPCGITLARLAVIGAAEKEEAESKGTSLIHRCSSPSTFKLTSFSPSCMAITRFFN